MTPGDTLTLSIEKPAAGGRMIARHAGAVVLVSSAIPGEVVEARVERVQRGTVWAATVRVVESSADRAGSDDGSCGGCVYAHIRYARQLVLKRDIIVDACARLGRLSVELPDVTPSAPSGYRMRARLHLREGRVGFFREGTHDVCAAGPTGQLLPETTEAIERLAARLPRASIAVAEIELAENREATERAIHLELPAGADPSRLGPVVQAAGLTGVSCASGGARTLELWGSPRVTDTLKAGASFALTRHARAFFQGNRHLIEPLMQHVVERVGRGPVVDLYAGVGLFSVAIAASGGGPVVAVEGDRVAADDLKRNAGPYRASVECRHQSVEEYLQRAAGPGRAGCVVVDPPRTGLSRQSLAGALAYRADRLVYVSCDVATLARDARAIVDAGYGIEDVRAFDLFPNTAHAETVMCFERSRSR
jgi:23S rRNA (uracil1939-C5)-methyltransferase